MKKIISNLLKFTFIAQIFLLKFQCIATYFVIKHTSNLDLGKVDGISRDFYESNKKFPKLFTLRDKSYDNFFDLCQDLKFNDYRLNKNDDKSLQKIYQNCLNIYCIDTKNTNWKAPYGVVTNTDSRFKRTRDLCPENFERLKSILHKNNKKTLHQTILLNKRTSKKTNEEERRFSTYDKPASQSARDLQSRSFIDWVKGNGFFHWMFDHDERDAVLENI